MKTGEKLMFAMMVLLIMGMSASCASSGQYMTLSTDETVIGTVQANFAVRSTALMSKSGKDAVNMQSYIHLMSTAGKQFPGIIDIRDIVWVTGKTVDHENTEISATGKVIQIK